MGACQISPDTMGKWIVTCIEVTAGMVSQYEETVPSYGMFAEKLTATHGLQQLRPSDLLTSTQMFDLAEPGSVRALEPALPGNIVHQLNFTSTDFMYSGNYNYNMLIYEVHNAVVEPDAPAGRSV